MISTTDFQPFFPQFSFFRKPVFNQIPFYKPVTPVGIHKYITGNYAKEATEKIKSVKDKKEANKLKCETFDFACFSGSFAVKNEKGLIKHSGLICIDFDEIKEREKLREKLLIDPFLTTILLFTSPSGNGLKWIVKINIETFSHLQNFLAIENYISETYKVRIDPSGKDIARPCFLPYDPDCYFNPAPENKNFEIEKWITSKNNIENHKTQPTNKTPLKTNGKQKTFDEILTEIEHLRIDITGDYYQWEKIGFAIASEFGENGRRYFHNISRFYPGYNIKECDKQYTAFLKHNGQGITIKSFYYITKQYGIEI